MRRVSQDGSLQMAGIYVPGFLAIGVFSTWGATVCSFMTRSIIFFCKEVRSREEQGGRYLHLGIQRSLFQYPNYTLFFIPCIISAVPAGP